MSPDPQSVAGQKPLPVWKSFAASAFAACSAELLTIPLDTAKVRLQLQAKSQGVPKYRGLVGTVGTVAKEEGLASLWAGWAPGMHRQVLYGGLRISLYDPVKSFFVGKDHQGDTPLYTKVAAGLTTGAIAIGIASPTDLVKVRMQSEGKRAQGAPKKYPNAFKAYGIIAREEGVLGLWKGIGPNMARNAIVNAAELATFDQIKEVLLKTPVFEDNIVCHLVAGLGAGVAAVCFGSPVDVVKSRMMGDSKGMYTGVLDCFAKTFRNDGIPAFYNGFVTNIARLGSWNAAMFVIVEQVKKMMRENES